MYIYGEDIEVGGGKGGIDGEWEVKNERRKRERVGYVVEVFEGEGKVVKGLCGEEKKINGGEKIVV